MVFNSATYDINSIKPYLFTNLVQHEQGDIVEEEKPITPRPHVFLIEKGNVYESITTPTLKFRDVKFFLVPGNSYASYLETFDVQEGKGVLCYEYIASLDKLEEPPLSPERAVL